MDTNRNKRILGLFNWHLYSLYIQDACTHKHTNNNTYYTVYRLGRTKIVDLEVQTPDEDTRRQ